MKKEAVKTPPVAPSLSFLPRITGPTERPSKFLWNSPLIKLYIRPSNDLVDLSFISTLLFHSESSSKAKQ